MRNPKFRIWNRVKKEWEVKEFYLIGEVMLLQGFPLEKLNDLEVNQFTDLFDRSGVEIAEGDIVRFKYEGDDGFWNNEYSKGYYSKPIVYSEGEYFIDDIFTPLWEHTPKVKIIGNIYENSNLIK